mmetsp:Transcript_43921/g.88024  ORF Transcript_43921/g.88024 Transcript_43921/m.88024 type:complete len:145 (-) Transcript_43921:25-459(-)
MLFLRHLSLDRSELMGNPACQLAAGLQSCRQLTKVDLCDNEIDSTGCLELAAALSESRNLRVLDLSNNCIRSEGLSQPTAAVEQWALVELWLFSNEIDDQRVRELVEASRVCTALGVLDLSRNFRMTEEEKGRLNRMGYASLVV